jgi:hypothetical protein
MTDDPGEIRFAVIAMNFTGQAEKGGQKIDLAYSF